MNTSRRKFLKIIGGGTIVAAAGAGGFLATRTPHKALVPWGKAGEYADYRKNALSYALLAPNPHNRQPWQVDLSRLDMAIIYRDKDRNLPETDPFDRQLTIGMGCFLELLKIAASNDDYTAAADLFPEGEDGPVAIVRFTKGAGRDPLFAQIMDRRSCKEPFSDKPVDSATVETLAAFANIVTDEASVSEIRNLTWEAFKIETYLDRTMKESVDLFRIGKREINANPDGIDLGGPFLETLALFGVLTREAQMDTNSTGFKQGLAIYNEMLMATPAYAVITSKGNTRQDQIDAGARWIRLNLQTTGMGLSLHPVSQALQEFPEMAEHYNMAHEMLAGPGETVQMLGRLGYGPKTGRTPRWPLETRLIDA
jgi:hypothetical protein